MPRLEGMELDSASTISMDSVFDWGDSRNLGQAASDDDTAPASRYDPKFMSRTTDILARVLIDDDSCDSSSTESLENDLENGTRGNKKKRHTKDGGVSVTDFCRKAIVVVSLVGMIIAACLAIGYVVVSHDPSERSPYSVVENGIPEQSLLEIAERVVTSCSEHSLDKDRSECQKLCRTRMCCFESGDYSCEDDGSKACAVYAGCDALVEGIPLMAEEEDEE